MQPAKLSLSLYKFGNSFPEKVFKQNCQITIFGIHGPQPLFTFCKHFSLRAKTVSLSEPWAGGLKHFTLPGWQAGEGGLLPSQQYLGIERLRIKK